MALPTIYISSLSSGPAMGLLWACYGSAMGLLWVCYGSAMGLLWVCYGSAMGLLWPSAYRVGVTLQPRNDQHGVFSGEEIKNISVMYQLICCDQRSDPGSGHRDEDTTFNRAYG